MKCVKCKSQMKKIDCYEEMAEIDEDATEGQLADYLASELSGNKGNWAIANVHYKCPKCGYEVEVMTEHLQNFDHLIFNWHAKASEEDFFSKYVFEYLAFIALLKTRVAVNAVSDRNAIQILKRSLFIKSEYKKEIERNLDLGKNLRFIVRELKKNPLHNSSRDLDNPEIDDWWNNETDKKFTDDIKKKGIIRSENDWINLVEFWYGVRNNLFHGGKDPSVKRDQMLVEYAFKTLNPFVQLEIEIITGKRRNII